mgnify:CR=1 FL=1
MRKVCNLLQEKDVLVRCKEKRKKTEDVTDEENKLEEKRIRQCSIIIKEAYKLTRQVDLPI